ncbi:MAG TPA: hypothetical protein RMH85_23525 [Polyangiaceae bacterium LLY-WYZ-15_(1-7)]|nr:hypothetical protein [Sandaracinus sp.]MBJ74920.1 hypothetical protein [Sandaracinus sp.]HJK90786.1 hypothetical protein [Polyangiaceae bacterium LLY-WYZ-15_(1-7)]HJK99940.1 hypothetical protein [Polyangiaceae bacterium LLY-WYZ-15_(1-7)]HJL11466.1 hypothetical protein [Polyangiaceae bacterium LLY-WYZ-15_(1-7)]
MTRRTLLWLAALALGGVAASAEAQQGAEAPADPAADTAADTAAERVTDRLALPLDGQPLDLEPMLGQGRVVELRGTVSSTFDGAELDAFARKAESARFEADGPFVLLPPGSELLEEDRLAHRYRVRLPAGDARVAFAIARLAARQLQTRSEAASQLRGRIEVLVVAPPVAAVAPSAAAAPPRSHRSSDPGPSGLGLALAGLGALFLPLLALGLVGRRRDRWGLLLRRARKARAAVEKEVDRLGPAYVDVEERAREFEALVARQQAEAASLRAAAARITGAAAEAQERRKELERDAERVLGEAGEIVECLEGVAAQLAAAAAEHDRARGAETAVAALGRELELALNADREARTD